jgi:hypothetical protein
VWASPLSAHFLLTSRRDRETSDIDGWLAVIAVGDGIEITLEATMTQYRRDGSSSGRCETHLRPPFR